MKIPIKIKITIIVDALRLLFTKPVYIIMAILTTLLMAGLIIWSLNFSLISYILFDSPLNILEKIEFFGYGYQSLFKEIGDIQSLGIIIFSSLFGINLSLLISVIKKYGVANVPKKSGSSAFILAILSGGCLACGTSLLTPLLLTLGVTSTALLHQLSSILIILGSFIVIYSIYKTSNTLLYLDRKENN